MVKITENQFIYPDWAAPNNVKALVTTRLGGVSKPPFDSFNLAMHVDDDVDNVITNRQNLSERANLPEEPFWLNQVHGTDIVNLDDFSDTDMKSNSDLAFDGSITTRSNRVCAIMTADCLPLFLCDLNGAQVAVLHVGWRGLANGIIENGIQSFKASAEHILAWAGPCISVNHFEVGVEVRQKLRGSDECYQPSESDRSKVFANLYRLTGERLANLGVSEFRHSNLCTFNDQELFFSYRRYHTTGRVGSIIWKE
ncbi:MAG: peptidoglycan editing factor PgeF [Acidiferrobacterales bacterium]|nr:peptidoglycan editing factor PgeF [Acidiferrobacterales bacterium]